MKGQTILVGTLLVGIALGVAGAVVLPPLARPYLPAALGWRTRVVEGEVIGKQREPTQVLLKVRTAEGPVLATFTTMVSQVDLLVERGDVVALAIPGGATPFADDPRIERVTHPSAPVGAAGEPASAR
jgi:hypothetical protein